MIKDVSKVINKLLAFRRALVRDESEVDHAMFLVQTGVTTRYKLLHMHNGPNGLTALNLRVMHKRTGFAVFSLTCH